MNREQLKGLKYSDYFKNHRKPNTIDGLLETNSSVPGNNILFVGGIHGNETAPVAAMIKLYKTFLARPELLKKGSISYLLANPKAVESTKKYIDFNLNRSFNNQYTGYENDRSIEIGEFLKSLDNLSFILDLHTVINGEFRLAIFNKKIINGIDYLEKTSSISYFASYENEFIPNTFLSSVDAMSIPSVGIVCGNNKSIKSIGVAYDQMIKTLEYYDMIEEGSIPLMKQNEVSENMVIFDIRDKVKPYPEFSYVDPNIKTGSIIKKGQIYATYKNGYHLSHEDRTVLLPKPNPTKNDKVAGFLAKTYKIKR